MVSKSWQLKWPHMIRTLYIPCCTGDLLPKMQLLLHIIIPSHAWNKLPPFSAFVWLFSVFAYLVNPWAPSTACSTFHQDSTAPHFSRPVWGINHCLLGSAILTKLPPTSSHTNGVYPAGQQSQRPQSKEIFIPLGSLCFPVIGLLRHATSLAGTYLNRIQEVDWARKEYGLLVELWLPITTPSQPHHTPLSSLVPFLFFPLAHPHTNILAPGHLQRRLLYGWWRQFLGAAQFSLTICMARYFVNTCLFRFRIACLLPWTASWIPYLTSPTGEASTMYPTQVSKAEDWTPPHIPPHIDVVSHAFIPPAWFQFQWLSQVFLSQPENPNCAI